MLNAKVVQATCDHHDQIRKVVLRVSQNIFHDPRTLDTSKGMFNFDTDFGHLTIALLLLGSQLFLVWLFFG